MEIIIPILISLSVGAVAWVVMRRPGNAQSVISRRMAGNIYDNLSFPYSIPKKTPLSRGKDNDLSLENSKSDQIAKNLYLAGMRSQQQVKIFRLLLRISLAVPLLMIISYAAFGALSTNKIAMALAVGIFLFFGVRMTTVRMKNARQKKILKSLPQFLDLVVVCVEAGLSFTSAVEKLLKELDPEDPLTKEIKVMHHEFLGGFTFAQACDRLARRCEVPDLSVLLSCIVQSDQMGSSLGATLRVQASELRDKFRQRVRSKALKVPVKILFPTMLIFVTIFVITLGPAMHQMVEALQSSSEEQTKIAKVIK